jgi:glucose-1-phosphate cytidylyltransferase
MTTGSTLVTVILCGGRGTRAYPHTAEIPKPLMDVDGRPIVRHVMDIYAAQGNTRFVLAAGFKADMMVSYAAELPDEWSVDVVDTGEDANKGERVRGVIEHVSDTFFLTYGDGVGNVDLGALSAFHRDHGGDATITVVPLPSQYGTLELGEAGRVRGFREKPKLMDHWINAGFMVVNRSAVDGSSGDLEDDVLPALSAQDRLYAYRHEGFWKSMDTYKDAMDLAAIAETSRRTNGVLPWLRSQIPASS